MFCRNCGSEVREGALFCPKCGTPVKNNSAPVGQAVNNQYQPDYQPNGTNNGANKSGSKAPIIIIIVVVALILLGGIIGLTLLAIGLFSSGSDDSSGSVNSYSPVTEEHTELQYDFDEDWEDSTDEEPEEPDTTETKTEPKTEPKTTSGAEPSDNSKDIKSAIEAYKAIVDNENANREFQDSNYAVNRYYQNEDSSGCAGFALIPIDNDDIPELVVWTDMSHAASAHLYTYRNSQVVDLGEYGSYGEFFYQPYKGIFESSYSGMGYTSFTFYKLKDGKVSKIVSGHDDEGAQENPDNATFYINEAEVSSEKYNEVFSKYRCGFPSLITPSGFVGYASKIGNEG